MCSDGMKEEVATSAAARPMPVDAAVLDDLAAAYRILAHQGVLDAWGHVSRRHPGDPGRYLCSRSLAPASVRPDDIMEFDLDSRPIDGQGRKIYLERFIHGEMYKARPDVMAIVHSHSPTVIPYSVTKVPLRAIFHNAAFLGDGAPVFESRDVVGEKNTMLVDTPGLGAALARTLGQKPVALMRGHGNVVVGASLEIAVFRAVYTEVNARLQIRGIL